MKTFKEYLKESLNEAYSFFPTDVDSINKELNGASWDKNTIEDVVKLYNYLKKKDATPINIDLKKPKNINISRTLQSGESVDSIITGSGITTFKLKWGNGSSGNRGANNRGNLFEKEFADSLYSWFEEGDDAVKDASMLAAIKDLDKTYNLSKNKDIWIEVVGGENTPRPIVYSKGKIVLTNTKGKGLDVGPSVTDVTVTDSKGKNIYLSLKLGGTTTFFNSGIKKVLTKNEIDSGEIKNKDGKALLKLFGIDNKRFCTIFNDKVKTNSGIVTTTPNAAMISALLESGIGYGYHILHKKGKTIESKQMDSASMKAAAKVGKCTIYYGGKKGKGKRIDMEFQSSYYQFKINIRDTQGTDGYPTRMMCDFKST